MLPLYIENVPDEFNQFNSNHFKFSGLLRISLVRVKKENMAVSISNSVSREHFLEAIMGSASLNT